jgi:hypothetical protein
MPEAAHESQGRDHGTQRPQGERAKKHETTPASNQRWGGV